MRKILLLIALCSLALVIGPNANASLVFYEPFNYTFGALTDVSLGNWTTHGANGTLSQWSTMNTSGDSGNSLSYPGFASSSGKRVYGDKSFTEDLHRTFSNVTPPGDLYCSMLVKCTEAPTAAAGDYFAHFNEGPIFSANFRARVFALPTTGGVTYGLSWGSLVQLAGATTIFSLNTTHLIVFKITTIGGATTLGNDTGSLWVDPPQSSFGGSAPAPYAVVTSTGFQKIASTSTTGLNDVSLRMGTANTHGSFEIDEIRIGTTWADVVVLGAPSISPSGTQFMNPGATRQFTASFGTGTYTWSLSTGIYGSIDTTAGNLVTFTASSVGTVLLTVNDGSNSTSVTITITPTSAPLINDNEGILTRDKRVLNISNK